MSFDDRCALLDRYRRGGTVLRYHTHRLLRRPNNAEHQWGAAMIFLELRNHGDRPKLADAWALETLHALQWILMHDVPEYDTGDVPAWCKRANPMLREALREIEGRVIDRLGMPGEPEDTRLRAMCRTSDELEHLWTCLDERRLGNGDVDSMFHRGARQLSSKLEQWTVDERTNGAWIARARVLLSGLAVRYVELQGAKAFGRMWNEIVEGRDYFTRAGDTA